jgi:hypothetical protein
MTNLNSNLKSVYYSKYRYPHLPVPYSFTQNVVLKVVFAFKEHPQQWFYPFAGCSSSSCAHGLISCRYPWPFQRLYSFGGTVFFPCFTKAIFVNI